MSLSRSIASSVVVTIATFAVLPSTLIAQANRIVVWVRPAASDEMLLAPDSSPALRNLARDGVSLPSVSRIDGAELVGALRALGKSLPDRQFHEIGAAGPKLADDPLAALRRRFGKPPPASRKDADAVKRLRKAGGEGGNLDVDDGSSGSKARPRSGGLAEAVTDAFDDGARLVLKIDSSGPTDATGKRRIDGLLASLSQALDSFDGVERVALVVVLLPENRRPAVLIKGSGFKRARVSRQRPDATDFAAGLARLLRADNAAKKGDATWVLSSLQDDARRKLDRTAKGES